MIGRHQEAKELATAALTVVLGALPTPNEVKYLMAVAFLETNYGYGWKGAGAGSNNMGAIQAGSKWLGEVFTYTDTSPQPDGTNKPYQTHFRKYPTKQEGWEDLAKVVYVNRGRYKVLEAARLGDGVGVSQALHATGYYEGYGRTVDDRIRNHFKALSGAIKAAETALTEPDTVHDVLRVGDRGEGVRYLQSRLGLAADGIFGPVTEKAVKSFQGLKGIDADGIVGPATWRVLLA